LSRLGLDFLRYDELWRQFWPVWEVIADPSIRVLKFLFGKPWKRALEEFKALLCCYLEIPPNANRFFSQEFMEEFKPANYWKIEINHDNVALATPDDKFEEKTPNQSLESDSEDESGGKFLSFRTKKHSIFRVLSNVFHGCYSR